MSVMSTALLVIITESHILSYQVVIKQLTSQPLHIYQYSTELFFYVFTLENKILTYFAIV